MKRFTAATLALALLLSCAALAQMNDPSYYLGHWEGGADYGGAHEYSMDINGYAYGRFSIDLNLYRIWSFEQMDAEMLPNGSAAVLLTNNADEYLVEGRLYFDKYSIDLEIIRSTFADLPAGTYIRFM